MRNETITLLLLIVVRLKPHPKLFTASLTGRQENFECEMKY